MQKRLACLLGLPVALLIPLMGCGPGPKAVFVPIEERPADSSWPFALPTVETPKEAAREGRVIQLAARFIAAHPGDLEKLGIDCAKPMSVVQGGFHVKMLEDLLRSRRAQLVAAPRVVVLPGRPGGLSVTTSFDYVGDYQQRKPDAPRAPAVAPIMHRIYDGMVLIVQAELDGDQVALTALEARMANGVGMRECKSRLTIGREVALLTWHEPVFLTSEVVLPASAKVVIGPGTAVALPLQHTLRVTEAKIRKLLDIIPVEVAKTGHLDFLSRRDRRGYRLPGHIVLLLTARVVEAKDAAGEPPAPKGP